MPALIEPLSSNDLLARAVQTLDDLLPDAWQTSLSPATDDPYVDRRSAPDALLEVTAPDGSTATFALAARMTLAGRDAAALLAMLRRWCESSDAMPLVVSRYLSSTVREHLTETGASLIDATGNVHLSSPAPAIALARSGKERDPWRRSHTRDALRGEPAARVVRALCDFRAPIPIARISQLADASAGSTYRVLDLLVDEGLAEKGAPGWIDSVDWPRLLRRWANDWSASERRFTLRLALPDDLDSALALLKRAPRGSFLLGGEHAAAHFTGEADPHRCFVHCDDTAGLIGRLGGETAADRTDSVLTVHGRGLVSASARSHTARGWPLAAPSQAYADLILAGDDAAAARLLQKMDAGPETWRKPA